MPIVTAWGNRLVWLLACLALASALAAGGWVQGLRADNARLTAANTQLTADLKQSRDLRATEQQVAAEHVVNVASITDKQRKSSAKLSTATERNRAWADERVPADVAAALGM